MLSMNPHFAFHAESMAFHPFVATREAAEAFVSYDTGAECTLKLWGCVATESPLQQSNQLADIYDKTATTIPVIFTVTFWEISRSADIRMEQMIRGGAEKDRKNPGAGVEGGALDVFAMNPYSGRCKRSLRID